MSESLNKALNHMSNDSELLELRRKAREAGQVGSLTAEQKHTLDQLAGNVIINVQGPSLLTSRDVRESHILHPEPAQKDTGKTKRA